MDAEKKTLGLRIRKREEWITTETWDMIGLSKTTKVKLLATTSPTLQGRLKDRYAKQDKEVKNGGRKDKKDYIERLATQLEKARAKQDMSTTLSCGYKTAETPVKKSDDTTACCLDGGKEHFERVLNQKDPMVQANITPSVEVLDIAIANPTLKEVTKAIQTLKDWKAPECDQIQSEVLKAEELVTSYRNL